MPNYSSISLANTKVKYTLFVFVYAYAIFLYSPSFIGQPVWDDITYWFYDPIMQPSFPYSEIWINFTWPLSVSLQKALMVIGEKNWWVYHSVNFTLHAFNSWLVYRLLRLLGKGLLFSFVGFVFFLIHPASVIAVAWMIQFKTLICFTFAFGSVYFFIRAKDRKSYVISIVLFLFSVLSKSSSLPFPLVLLFLMGKSWRSRKALLLIPYFVISIGGYYRLTHSPYASQAINQAAEVNSKVVEEPAISAASRIDVTASFEPVPDEPLVMPERNFAPRDVSFDKPEKWDSPVEPTITNEDDSKFVAHTRLFIKALYYYFWQAFVPVDNSPVKGLNPFPPVFQDYLHLVFLLVMVGATWNLRMLPALAGAHVLLLPYLGIIPAPYMNVTWVSDQHLYLALPCFIIFILGLVKKVKLQWVLPPIGILLIFFSVKTYEASRFYRNNFVFYESSINSNINNIPIAYNLALLYVIEGRQNDATNLLETIVHVSEDEPYIKDNRYFPFIVSLYSQLVPK